MSEELHEKYKRMMRICIISDLEHASTRFLENPNGDNFQDLFDCMLAHQHIQGLRDADLIGQIAAMPIGSFVKIVANNCRAEMKRLNINPLEPQ